MPHSILARVAACSLLSFALACSSDPDADDVSLGETTSSGGGSSGALTQPDGGGSGASSGGNTSSGGQSSSGAPATRCAAPPCADGELCEQGADCTSLVCAGGTCSAPTYEDGIKNGDEGDVDCGGAAAPVGKTCAVGMTCAAHHDCTSNGCGYAGTCVDAPSCTPRFGGDTCGPGEVEAGGAGHESCCKTLPVAGFVDPRNPDSQVYLDKYEITAGRVRAFIERISADNGGVPNVRGWLDAHQPDYWNPQWNVWMPTDHETAIPIPRGDLHEEHDFGTFGDVGLDRVFGYGGTYFYVHGDNCHVTADGIYGYPTYWYPDDIMTTKNAGGPRALTKDQLDTKAMNCIPNAVLAAFCAWDGGQLATSAVLRHVANTGAKKRSTIKRPTCTDAAFGRLVPMATGAGALANFTCDAGQAPFAYFFPAVGAGVTDGASRIAAPGRMASDVVRIAADDDPWQDLRGNVHEASLADAFATPNDATTLAFGGNHFNGIGTASGGNADAKYPEFKSAWTGGRCMRFAEP